mmetsp:Transcript_8970/g.21868  ORF Transcript_8970/g.21868 Transcript_8970/m.21868 type:complete len:248 (+) Transcript_8970:392-1135(+)
MRSPGVHLPVPSLLLILDLQAGVRRPFAGEFSLGVHPVFSKFSHQIDPVVHDGGFVFGLQRGDIAAVAHGRKCLVEVVVQGETLRVLRVQGVQKRRQRPHLRGKKLRPRVRLHLQGDLTQLRGNGLQVRWHCVGALVTGGRHLDPWARDLLVPDILCWSPDVLWYVFQRPKHWHLVYSPVLLSIQHRRETGIVPIELRNRFPLHVAERCVAIVLVEFVVFPLIVVVDDLHTDLALLHLETAFVLGFG